MDRNTKRISGDHERCEMMKQLTIEEKEIVGKQLVEILILRKDTTNKERYQTTWGNKTAIGIYETVCRIVNNVDLKR